MILDTNVISEAAKLQMDVRVREWFISQAAGSLYTTAVNLAEVSYGIEKMPDGRRKTEVREDMETFFKRHFQNRILPFDEQVARTYGRILADARARGRSILIADGQIAAIAQSRGLTVATRDTGPFEAAGVPVVNPWML